jgi:hypothetical protein
MSAELLGGQLRGGLLECRVVGVDLLLGGRRDIRAIMWKGVRSTPRLSM